MSIQGHDNNQILTLTGKLDGLVTEIASLKTAITSTESVINKKLENLQAQVDKPAEIISKQQLFLETLDSRERESQT